MRGWRQKVLQRAGWIERTEEEFVGVVEDVAVAQGGGAGVDAADGQRDGRKDEKPSVGKRLAEERGNVPRVPHPPRKDENEGAKCLSGELCAPPFCASHSFAISFSFLSLSLAALQSSFHCSMKYGASIHTIASRGKITSIGQNRMMRIHIAESNVESRLISVSFLFNLKIAVEAKGVSPRQLRLAG